MVAISCRACLLTLATDQAFSNRIRPLGFDLINGGHQQNFGKSETAERVLRDLEHG